MHTKAGFPPSQINKLLIECPKITIAAVNGPRIGYGASSIGLFDLVYVVPDAYFFAPFIKWAYAPRRARASPSRKPWAASAHRT